MIRVAVKEPFVDKYTGEFYDAGRVIEVSEERAEEIKEFVEKVKKGRKPKG